MDRNNNQITFTALDRAELKFLIKECLLEHEADNELNGKPSPADEQLLSIDDLARLFKKSKATIHNWINSDKLPEPIYISRFPYFKKTEIYKMLER